jgi:hypothetical protein
MDFDRVRRLQTELEFAIGQITTWDRFKFDFLSGDGLSYVLRFLSDRKSGSNLSCDVWGDAGDQNSRRKPRENLC